MGYQHLETVTVDQNGEIHLRLPDRKPGDSVNVLVTERADPTRPDLAEFAGIWANREDMVSITTGEWVRRLREASYRRNET